MIMRGNRIILGMMVLLAVYGCQQNRFDGFTVKGTRGDAISISGSNNTVENCLIKNIAGNAVIVNGYNNLVYSNEITRTGKGGISLDGGVTFSEERPIERIRDELLSSR